MLETIREFASERLEASGEAEATHRAHAACFLAFAERHELSPFAPLVPGSQNVLAAERANLLAALRWLTSSGDRDGLVRLAAALGWFWWVSGEVRLGTEWLERARSLGEHAGSTTARMKVALAYAYLAFAANDYRRAETVYAEVHRRAVALGDARYEMIALSDLGNMNFLQGAHEEAVRRAREALTMARAQADPWLAAVGAAQALIHLGGTARELGRPRDAAASLEEALGLLRSAGDPHYTMHCLCYLGEVALDLGDPAGAGGHFHEALRFAMGFGYRRVVVRALAGLAGVAAGMGQVRLAATIFGAVERLRETTGITARSPADRAIQERAIAAARSALGEAAFSSAWAAGRALSPEQAVAEAMAVTAEATGAPPGGGARSPTISQPLTPRESEILCLLVAGHTDRAIAEALFLSVRTVEAHVARILAKLGVHSRTAAVAAALAAGLVEPHPPTPD
jgi:non-specific serine/threonine protein kinase